MSAKCESCGMPITDGGAYCSLCVDDSGQLQAFEQRLERMMAWQARHQPNVSREVLERNALAYMAAMPAWKDHPRIKAAFPDS